MKELWKNREKKNRKPLVQHSLRDRASAIVAGAEFVSGFRVMDRESENMLQAILGQYDGNDNNYVNFNIEDLPQYLQDSFSLECETLQMYGMLSSVMNYVTGSMITLSESVKKYFSYKESA